MFLAAGDRAGAESVLTTLQDDWRLDALNLRYAEARLLSRFDDWSQLTKKPWFDELCRASKPAVVTRILLEAVWHTYLEPLEGHKIEQQARYADGLRTLCVDMLDDVQDALDKGASSIAVLEASLAVPESAVERTLTVPASSTRCQNWTDWAASLLGLSPHAIAELTREVALRQPASILASTEAVRLAEQLQALSDSDRRDVLRPALPVVVDWLRDDPEFPRRDMLELYDTTVTLFAYLEDRGQAARDAFLAILDGTLSLGLKDTQYRRLLQDAGEFVDPEAGLSTVYWLFELAETLLRHPGPDSAARQALMNSILSSMRMVLPILTALQRAAYDRVAVSVGWPPLPTLAVDRQAASLSSSLLGKRVAIYTLTEAAGRQAIDVLAQLAPNTEVDLATDHVCSDRLQALSRNSDIFVVATASAKHAATECIHRHRSSNTIVLYAAGRGVSSILRAIEDHVAK
jgi:hypothetical protein